MMPQLEGGRYGYSKAHFLSELRIGYQWQLKVGQMLSDLGFTVSIDPLTIAQSEEETREFTKNDKDLLVNGKYLEVKTRSITFTTPDSFPYPTAILETVQGWQAKATKPFAILLVSRPTGRVLVVDGATQPDWTINRDFDSRRKVSFTNYHADKSQLLGLSWLIRRLKGDGDAGIPHD